MPWGIILKIIGIGIVLLFATVLIIGILVSIIGIVEWIVDFVVGIFWYIDKIVYFFIKKDIFPFAITYFKNKNKPMDNGLLLELDLNNEKTLEEFNHIELNKDNDTDYKR